MNTDAYPIAQQLFEAGEYSACEILLSQYTMENNLDVNARHMLGRVYEGIERPELALQQYQAAIRIADATDQDATHLREAVEQLHQKEAEAEEAERQKEARAEALRAELRRQKEEDEELYGAPAAPDPVDAEDPEDAETSLRMRFKLTPYFGFVENPNQPGRNNFGLPYLPDTKGAKLPYYPEPGADELIVGLFGASVSAEFYQYAGRLLEEGLANHPDIGGRAVTVLSFTPGAAKQPQPMNYLAYFAGLRQPLDLVINIDGANEISAGLTNNLTGYDITMPSSGFIGAFLALENLPGVDRDHLRHLLKLDRLDRWIGKLERFGLAAMLKRKRAVEGQRVPPQGARSRLIHYQRVKKPVITEQNKLPEYFKMLDEIVENWGGYSKVMIDICAGTGAKYVHVVHPSCAMTDREFTGNDKKIIAAHPLAFDTHPHAYRAMIEKAKAFSEIGSHASYCDMGDVLEQTEGEVLHDIFHFKQPVYEAMAHRLVEYLATIDLSANGKG